MKADELLAHGIGNREDLPLPLSLVLIGAALAIVLSFLALALLWRTPKFEQAHHGLPLPRGVQHFCDSRGVRWSLRALGLIATSYVVLAAVAGKDDALNPVPGVVYVLFWIGVPLLSLLIGPMWRLLNPIRTLHHGLAQVVRVSPRHGVVQLSERVGYWPAAGALFVFVWLELAVPDNTSLSVLRTFFAVYLAAQLMAAACFGSTWFERGDGFEVYSTLAARLSSIGRRQDGRLVLRNPLRGLSNAPALPGLLGVVGVLLGSTAYDSLSNAPWWVSRVQESSWSPQLISTVALIASIATVTGAFAAGAVLGGLIARPAALKPTDMPREFAHSILPIAVGYVIAHYWTLLVLIGQATVVRLSDPLGTGANWLGTADRGVDQTLAQPGFVAVLQVLAIVTGHVLAVVLAHERAVVLFAPKRAAAGQVPLTLLMLLYTVGGLSLLFAT